MKAGSKQNSTLRLVPFALLAAVAALVAVFAGGGAGGGRPALGPHAPSAVGGAPRTGTSEVAARPARSRPRDAAERTALESEAAGEQVAPAGATGVRPGVPTFLLGRVLDEDGGAIGQAEVRLSPAGREPGADPEAVFACETNDDGLYRVLRAPWMGSALTAHVRARGFVVLQDGVALEEGAADASERWLEDLVLERGVVLAGVVLDAAGEPVEGACVWRDSAGREDTLEELRFVMGVFGAEGAGVGRTDEDGRFELPNEEAGPFELRVAHGAHPELRFEGEAPTPGALVGELVLRLGHAASIEGRVRGWPGDRPGVVVRAEPRRGPDEIPRTLGELIEAAGMGRGRMTLIGADGAFEVEGLEPGAPYEVGVVALGPNGLQREACSEAVTAVAGGRPIELVWDSGASIHLLALGAGGLPAREVTVRYSWRERGPQGRRAWRERRFPDGRVELDGLRPASAPGTLDLAVEAVDHLPWRREGVVVPAGRRVELGPVTLERAPRLRVVVLDHETDTPLAGAALSARPPAPPAGAVLDPDAVLPRTVEGESDGQGVCGLTLPFSGPWVLEVSRRGFATRSIEGASDPRGAEVADLFVRLRHGGRVAVRVLDEEGRQVERATVLHRDPEGVRESRRAEGAEAVEFADLGAGLHHFRAVHGRADVLSVQEGPWSVEDEGEWSAVMVRPGGEEVLVLHVPTLTLLEGRVYSRGVPCAGAKVTFLIGAQGGDAEERLAQVPGAMTGLLRATLPRTRADGDGRFRFEDVPVGDHRLRVVGLEGAPPLVEAVEIRPGHNEIEIDLPLASIEGRVVDRDGLPVAGAIVRAMRAPEGEAETPDEAGERLAAMELFREGPRPGQAVRLDGSFRLEGVPAGIAIVLEAGADGFVDQSTGSLTLSSGEVRAGQRLVLERGGAIVVTVRGAIHPLLKVWARRIGAPARTRVGYAGGGLAELRELLPGRWKVSLGDKAGEGAAVEVDVWPLEQTWVELAR
ncbi:MAG: hypothetical protein QF903_10815 [Planctomycetota bacterium]|nr:hypothetical protein [Planctomycetota bacterium]MDP6764274.1 hypothetical protein [Planctomycetota bacterium]MDP6989960.1 hypothetical protein [Planctomycetota bacterium]